LRSTKTDGRIQALTLLNDGSTLYIGGYINHVWHLGPTTDAVLRPGAAAVSTVDGTVDPNFFRRSSPERRMRGWFRSKLLRAGPGTRTSRSAACETSSST
jgi:hypothetical protein